MNLQEHHDWPASKAVMSTYDTQPVQTHKVGIGKREPIEVTLDIVHSRSPKLFLAAAAPVKRSKVKACLCLHSTVSTLWDCSTCLTVHSPG